MRYKVSPRGSGTCELFLMSTWSPNQARFSPYLVRTGERVKTTLVRILATLLLPDAGSVTVAGLDVVEDAALLRTTIGLTGQFSAINLLLTGRENLEMVGELCHLLDLKPGNVQTSFLMNSTWLSGGPVGKDLLRRHASPIRPCCQLGPPATGHGVGEPTTGLDPGTRAAVWRTVENLVDQGTTVLLTTQYLEEADRLAHRIAVIDHGQSWPKGPPTN